MLAHGWWFSQSTLASSTTKTGCHDIAESGVKHQKKGGERYLNNRLELFYILQVVEDGYEFFAKRQLVTLFSAPNYCGEFDNAGAMMSVDETLMCSFQVWPSYL